MSRVIRSDNSVPRPAATVILLRDGPGELETLLLRRNEALAWAGGYWVFPGGAIDPEDRLRAGGDEALTERLAAIREAREEAGVAIDGELVSLGRWITPVGELRRYTTAYFAVECAPDIDIVVDGSEILEHRWLGVSRALAQHREGALAFYPPTWLTLSQLTRFGEVGAALAGLAAARPLHVLPVFDDPERPGVAMFEGDAGYVSGDADHAGPRHRVWKQRGHWIYDYSGVPDTIRPLDGRDLGA